MAYTPEKPPLSESAEELRARIPGWGVDLDPKDRPAFPRERFDPEASGAHWTFPERQEPHDGRERSIEHQFVTPVFGTSVGLKGLSGVMRRAAYRRYSEARAAHWLILLAADRVDVLESNLGSLLSLHPDNPVTETGIVAEVTHGGLSSRLGRERADLSHRWIDPIIVATPWVAGAAVAWSSVKRARALASRTR
jgi:hypothetical protein